MGTHDLLDSDRDPFRPPPESTIVSCLHCGEEYDSYRIEWRVLKHDDGKSHGFWCCPIETCDGKGFGFDIFPVNPDFHDERGGWVMDDGPEEGAGPFDYQGEGFANDEPHGENGNDQVGMPY